MRSLHVVMMAAAAALVGGCTAADVQKLPGMGLPADAPPRPAVSYEYPAVHDMPPPRADITMSDEQRDRMERELVTTRDRQEERTHTKGLVVEHTYLKKKPAKPVKQADERDQPGAKPSAKTNP